MKLKNLQVNENHKSNLAGLEVVEELLPSGQLSGRALVQLGQQVGVRDADAEVLFLQKRNTILNDTYKSTNPTFHSPSPNNPKRSTVNAWPRILDAKHTFFSEQSPTASMPTNYFTNH